MRLLKLGTLALLLTAATSTFAANAEVYSKAGNIYYSQDKSHPQQITRSAKDRSPVISADKKLIAYIREVSSALPKDCHDFVSTNDSNATEVWVYDVDAKKEHLVVANNFACAKPEKEIVDADNLKFSPDNKTLYFQTTAWPGSYALHAVSIDGSHQRYLMPAVAFEVIPKGHYKGYLLVEQRKIVTVARGPKAFALVSPEGKEARVLSSQFAQNQIQRLLAL